MFGDGCFATDDSITSLAVAKAIMKAAKGTAPGTPSDSVPPGLTVKYMRGIGRKYPACGFGAMVLQWVFSDSPETHESFGNGAAMRVSPAGFAATDERDAERLARAGTEVTHNHPEGIKGAVAVAVAISMARRGALKGEIRARIQSEYYPLDFKIDDIRATYRFNETCQETVPQAAECFLEAASFEDAIRTAISLGGDSDTIDAITGSMAEAYYGVPDGIAETALTFLDQELRAIHDEWERFAPVDGGRFRVLTKSAKRMGSAASVGEWTEGINPDGTLAASPHVDYSGLVVGFQDEFYQFVIAHPEYGLGGCGEILERNGLTWDRAGMRSADLDHVDEQVVLALIAGAIRAERFCDGALLGFLEDGSLVHWLKRLEYIDAQRRTDRSR